MNEALKYFRVSEHEESVAHSENKASYSAFCLDLTGLQIKYPIQASGRSSILILTFLQNNLVSISTCREKLVSKMPQI